jgi:hypothetical protein
MLVSCSKLEPACWLESVWKVPTVADLNLPLCPAPDPGTATDGARRGSSVVIPPRVSHLLAVAPQCAVALRERPG